MRDYRQFYIDGRWIEPAGSVVLEVENPATEESAGRIALGSEADVEQAVAAARTAFPAWSASSLADRLERLDALGAEYERRSGDLAEAVTEEMGAPASLAARAQVPIGLAHIRVARSVLENFAFEETRGSTLIVREPIGVCAMITPWNWPLNQIACKVAPAIATGCAMVLKPSEIAPFSGHIFAEIMDAAGFPAGVFNLVHGDGPGVGVWLSRHPEVDMVSFTGSTRAGVEVARNAAPTIKRVAQELGGKSPNIIVDGAGLSAAVRRGVSAVMMNSGQSCNAPTRMLVPHGRLDEAAQVAAQATAETTVGRPDGNYHMGPVVSKQQYDRIQELIAVGIAEGAELVAGGLGRPEGLDVGHYVRPTVFTRVSKNMRIAREEIFGPVLTILGYSDHEEAITIANDTEYGLAAYVQAEDTMLARGIARRLRAGQVSINSASDINAPFGGYKMSGNGREWGEFGFAEYLETKAILGGV